MSPTVAVSAADDIKTSIAKPTAVISTVVPTSATPTTTASHSTALIKSLLANKVTTVVGDQSPVPPAVKLIGGNRLVASNTAASTSLLTTNVNVLQVN